MSARALARLRCDWSCEMLGKINAYELLSAFVPGILLVSTAAVLFPDLVAAVRVDGLPDAFAVIVLTVVAYFAGQVIQAISSLIEPCVHRSWGGRPSERALTAGLGDRYLPESDAKRIAAKLREEVGEESSERSLFLKAMLLTRTDGKSLESSFNGAYAYHRALLTMALAGILMLVASRWVGAAMNFSGPSFTGAILGLALLSVLLWHRCRQRANYYCREVLLAAERHLNEKANRNS